MTWEALTFALWYMFALGAMGGVCLAVFARAAMDVAARQDYVIKRAQQLAGGMDRTTLRTRAQRRDERNAARAERGAARLDAEAARLLERSRKP